MPIISVTMGKIEKEKKAELIEKLTATAVGVTGIPEQSFTILINELDDYNIGLAGRTLAEVKAAR